MPVSAVFRAGHAPRGLFPSFGRKCCNQFGVDGEFILFHSTYEPLAKGMTQEERGCAIWSGRGLVRQIEREGFARRFFENWRASLKWQRLKSYETFAAIIRSALGWDCRLLSTREQGLAWLRRGVNNKIRVIQRRAYGLRNEDYLRLQNPDLYAARPVAVSGIKTS
jgi:hypothetical protein